MNILDKICETKIEEIKKLKKEKSFDGSIKPIKSFFLEKLKKKNNSKFNVITELKKKSPSKGLLREDFDPVKISKLYQKAGADCLSVLTDKIYFGGDINYIQMIKKEVDLPILRKDFIIDEFQVYESHYYEADCILLIFAILTNTQISRFYRLAKSLGMDVICEIHNEMELKRAIELDVECIGINNRNLKTLEVNIENFTKMSKKIPEGIFKICESGITHNTQLFTLSKFGADAFLIGENLMKSQDIYKTTFEMIKK